MPRVFLPDPGPSDRHQSDKSSDQEKGIAPSELGEGGRDVRKQIEILPSEPCGLKPAQESLTNDWKRVLRGVGQPPLRSVDSQSKGHAIEPRNSQRRSPRVSLSGGRGAASLR